MTGTRMLLVGAGRFGALHARVWAEAGALVVGVVDVDASRAAELARQVGASHHGTDLTEALAATQPDIAVIATDEASHARLASQVLSAGHHVFVEKPFALDPGDAATLARLAEVRGLLAFAGHISRFAAPYTHMRGALDAGRVGDLWSIRLRRDFSRTWWETFGDRVHPVWESGIHDIDLAIHFAGSRPSSVVAVSPAAAGSAAPSIFSALLTFDSGVVATIESAWAVPERAPATLVGALALEGTIAAECELIGSAGVIKQRLVSDALVEWTESGVAAPDLSLWPESGGHVAGALRAEVDEVIALVSSKRSASRMPASEAVWGVQVAAAIEASLASGAVVTI